MTRQDPATWVPVGVPELEPAADDVVRSFGNRLVVAGPGAGKTELLAQRASFLLDTGTCRPPHRILAISFKRDAAKNLDERVRKRCGDQADRFDSFTLDAFAKRLVDRFFPGLPEDWRPRPGYQVRTSGVTAEDAELWMDSADVPDGADRPQVRGWGRDKVRRTLDDVMHGAELPYDGANLHTILRAWGVQWWREQLAITEGTPSLTFPMLNRLAAFLLRKNVQILAALRDTYSHVFLDEFQDTSASQWDLVRASFRGSDAKVTAVGDEKQRIMVWAGAKTDVFDAFVAEFAAERVALVRNYRSVPELVRMQHFIAQAVETGSIAPVSTSTNRGAGVCEILEFKTPEQEAACLAKLIGDEVAAGNAAPRDFCVLARQLVGPMVGALQAVLRSHDVVLRDESALQDLRVEPLAAVVLSALRLATTRRDATRWGELIDLVVSLTGLHEVRDEPEVERLATFHKTVTADALAAGVGLDELPMRLINILGAGRYRSTFRQYGGAGYLEKVAKDLGSTLQVMSTESRQGPSGVWDTFMGVNVLPAMTIHKSKGLEFGTVIFLGLEDSQWWGFREQPEEEKRAFFVAFSRAIGRVYFTWCDERDGRYGRQRQQRRNVEALHDILTRAGVETLNLRGA